MNNINNKYIRLYWKICERAKDRKLDKDIYIEKHHIYPKSIYGQNKDLVKLTGKEHYIVHLLLWRALRTEYGTSDDRTRKMCSAFAMMNCKNIKNNSNKFRYSSKTYVFLRIAHKERRLGCKHTEEAKKKIGEASKGNSYCLGYHHTNEAKKRITESAKGRVKSNETRQKLSIVNKGKKLSEEHKEKIGNGNRGKKVSDETKEKLRITSTGKKHTEESKQKMSERMKGF